MSSLDQGEMSASLSYNFSHFLDESGGYSTYYILMSIKLYSARAKKYIVDNDEK